MRAKGGRWLVPSQTNNTKGYIDSFDSTVPNGVDYRCDCAEFQFRHTAPQTGYCKHIYAVMVTLTAETNAERTERLAADGTRTVTEKVTTTVTKRTTYKQVWPAYNAAQTQGKATFLRLLADLCAGVPEPEQHMGRKRIPLRDSLFGATFKVYSTLSGRRFQTDLRDAQTAGHISRAPHYNSLFRCFEDPALTPILQELVSVSAAPLASIEDMFAVDATGFTTTRFARWFDHKWGDVKEKREWMKVHAMVGTKTQIVTAVDVSHGYANDAPYLAPLTDKTAETFTLTEVSADRAYLSRKNFAAVDKHGAVPFIPFKSNSVAWGIARNTALYRRRFHYFNMERDAFMAQYHKRSNVEAAFSMMKRKFGDSLRSKTQVAQFNEALCKVLCHNICYFIQSIHELGITPHFWQEAAA